MSKLFVKLDKHIIDAPPWTFTDACGLIILITLLGCSAVLIVPVFVQ